MANFNIDRLKFRWKGNWVTGTNYTKDDVVYYDGKAYVCLQGHTASTFYNDQYTNDNVTFTVTVSTDTLDGNAQGKLYINGVENPSLPLIKGKTYIFNQNAESNDDDPILFSNVVDGDLLGGARYNNGVVYYIDGSPVSEADYITNFAAATTREVRFTPPATAPKKLYYYSAAHKFMGNFVKTQYTSNWEIMFDGSAWREEWATGQFYTEGSFVKYNGYIYKCTTAHTSTTTLTTDIANWTLFASTYNWLNVWATDTDYVLGDIVRNGGNTYICVESHTSAATSTLGLEDDQAKWTIVATSDDWKSNWTVSTRYKVNDTVRYGAIVYRCILEHTSAATATLGLENDQAKWEIVNSGIEFKGNWAGNIRYKLNDVVKSGSTLWKANEGHTSTNTAGGFRTDEDSWDIFVPGLYYDVLWSNSNEYVVNDIVLYGGYTYLAIANSLNATPSDSPNSWQLLTTGYKFQGDWTTSATYKTGDVVRSGGNVYVAISDSSSAIPSSDTSLWTKIVEGYNYRAEWEDGVDYYEGDIVVHKGTAYVCINQHASSASDSRPDLDIAQPDQDYWTTLIGSTENNVLAFVGDIKTYDTAITNLNIGSAGEVLKSTANGVDWSSFDLVSNVFYVSVQGLDIPTAGRTIAAPFRTVRYACEYIKNNIDVDITNTTIFIKTGFYEEILPISVPRNCVLIGDELRSTTISAASGYELSDMFYVNNGSGIRNMTLQGLNGTLGAPGEFLTRRPTAGAYVSLDPGTGPSDTSVHILSKSPYIQNVTTFGTGCVGLKIDGSLHSGGYTSIVANDFTQVLSDGIGVWANNVGRSELVSVFTYYCHIGYLATDGGILRATNGNNSYGTYGTVAEKFFPLETPKTGVVNNRTLQAQFSEAITYGTNEQKILAIGYSHAGQAYTSASITFGGSGLNAAGSFTEIRNNAISNIRMLDPGDSSIPGGLNYTYVVNNAQSGNTGRIRLSQADTKTPAEYIGQRIVIISGLGVGQYAEITGYDETSKIAIVSKETDGSLGWDHFQPGWPIEPILDSTTRYAIEPRVDAEEPAFVTSNIDKPSSDPWKFIAWMGDKFVGVASDDLTVAYSNSNGDSWSTPDVVSATFTPKGIAYTGTKGLIIADPATGTSSNIWQSANGTTWSTVAMDFADSSWKGIAANTSGNVVVLGSDQDVNLSSNDGDTWTSSNIGGVAQVWNTIAYGNGKFVAIEAGGTGDVAYSSNNGSSWTIEAGALTPRTWTNATYGNGRFVIIDNTGNTAISFDGITWYESSVGAGTSGMSYVSYGAGVFIASGDNTTIAKSADGFNWRTWSEDSTSFTATQNQTWTASAYGNSDWVLLSSTGAVFNRIETGARPIIRAKVASSRLSELVIYDPGSNIQGNPVVTVIDNSNTVDAAYEIFKNVGVLPQPEMSNRGTGYFTATATVSGDGYAQLYQTGKFLEISNLTGIPEIGDNLVISGIDDVLYSVVRLESITGSGPYDVRLQITPTIDVAESPNHNTAIELRQQFSQVRLTGHDFLDIGTGNISSTRYPTLYLEGEDAENARQPFNEALGYGGGRVFYTSTDQDGNFKVGLLFKVEQSTGIVTIDATQFDLSGLTELSLGGIQVGVTPVVIREFSTDPDFTANSNSIVPTQRAIASYIESRITGGGSDATTNTLTAGQVVITGNSMFTTSDLSIDVSTKTNVKGGFDGKYLALQYFARSRSK